MSAYELVLLIIMLVAANAVGFGTYIVDKGLVATISTPLLLVLFLLALIYEIRLLWAKAKTVGKIRALYYCRRSDSRKYGLVRSSLARERESDTHAHAPIHR